MPLSDTELNVVLVDENGDQILVIKDQFISGSGAPVSPFYLAAGVKPDGGALPIQLDANGDLKINTG